MTEKIMADRKQFFLDLKENARGRVVKITEDVNGRRDNVDSGRQLRHNDCSNGL